ncbi:ABC transporter ATP-binding protein [Flavicella sp.]|uniref:ABC transporter ATP-binding protein n=1 Tax=Flavicella sp. TaxID=2957742 RepID=UPI00261D8FF5|nr:ABC transporter ATP-binding protein [Flavicella sp.]MDG1804668.1 ABC transporter ATP-binding protein [Flavicella sp.]
MKKVIETIKVHKIFGEGEIAVHALNDVSIQINEGEFTALVGPSGSGKTTLLNMIGGLDTPNSGNIILNDQDIAELNKSEMTNFRQKNIGFVFQAYNLIPVLSAYENAEFIMLLQDIPTEERKERVYKLLKEVGLEGKEDNKPGELSGGQQQRVAVVRALAAKPAYILADEPTANLDSTSTKDLLDLMARLNQEENMTFVFSTHDQRVIDRAKRVIYLDDGKIVNDEQR